MASLDTISLECDPALILDIDESRFHTMNMIDSKGNEIYSEGKVLPETLRPYAGLNRIKLTGRKLEVEFSAKILQRDYHKLITTDTFPQAIEAISKTGIVILDPLAVMDWALINRCDVTDDLHVDKPTKDYMKSLRVFGGMNPKFETRPYKHGGVTFKQLILKNAQRTTLYPKANEIAGDRYRDVLDVDRFEDVVRIESNLNTFVAMRKLFGTDSRTPKDILQTDTGVNLHLLKKIVDVDEITESKKKFKALLNSDLKFSKLRQLKGDMGIIEDCGYDINLIRAVIESKIKGNASDYVRQFRDVMRSMEQTDEQGETIDESYIRELTDLLKVA